MQNRTIAAISTPYGRGAISLIRITGEGAFAICESVFKPKSGKTLGECRHASAVYGDIIFENEIIDDGIATVFKTPNSYTGEDTVEIACHGGILVTKTVLDALLSAGAYPAEAGEFTKRAYANGKLRLSEAEAIMDIIDARTPSALKLANASGRGRLSDEAEKIYSRIKTLLASIYAYIDYPDEDLTDVTVDEMKNELKALRDVTARLERSYKTGKAVRQGVKVAICGKPNVGKSSVLNMFTGEDTAIVTDIEGTTRDVIKTQAVCGDILLDLSDTAGIRQTSDTVESIGVERAVEEIKKAELILAVFDTSRTLDTLDCDILKTLENETAVKIALLNKTDKECLLDTEEIKKHFEHFVCISAETKDGKDELDSLINRLFTDGAIDYGTPYISNARQYSEVCKCKSGLESALSALENGLTQDMASFDLEDALSAISRLDGREMTDDVVNEIFSKFCVGK